MFYYLLNGADHALKDKLHLLEPNEYHYLGRYSVVPLDGVDEGAEFKTMCESLEMLGFRKELQIRWAWHEWVGLNTGRRYVHYRV